MSQVIGSGVNGCVHQPSLTCAKRALAKPERDSANRALAKPERDSANRALAKPERDSAKRADDRTLRVPVPSFAKRAPEGSRLLPEPEQFSYRDDEEFVSKTANINEILDEMKYIKMIDEIDPYRKYHVGVDKECEIENSYPNRAALSKCNGSKRGETFGDNVIRFMDSDKHREDAGTILEMGIHEDTIKHLKGYRPKNVDDLEQYAEVLYAMVIMQNGGPDLNKWGRNQYTVAELRFFLEKSRNLFKGIIHFQKHGIVLNDVKTANIVYNGQDFKFIDFGMTKRISEIKESAASSEYVYSIIHWNFPWEMYFLDRNHFDNLSYFEINNEMSAQMNDFFKQSKESKDNQEKHMQDFYNFRRDCKKNNVRYEDYVDKCLRTIDSFGLGLAMLVWLRSVDSQFHDRALFERLEQLYKDMTCQNLFERMTIDKAFTELNKLLKPKSKFTPVPTLAQLREQNKISSTMRTGDSSELPDYEDSPQSKSSSSSSSKSKKSPPSSKNKKKTKKKKSSDK